MKFIPPKSQYSFSISLNLSQKRVIKGHNSVKNLRMTPKLKLFLYFMMLYLTVEFEIVASLEKVSYLKQQFDNLAGI